MFAVKFGRRRSKFAANNTQPQDLHVDLEYFIRSISNSTLLRLRPNFAANYIFSYYNVVSRKPSRNVLLLFFYINKYFNDSYLII